MYKIILTAFLSLFATASLAQTAPENNGEQPQVSAELSNNDLEQLMSGATIADIEELKAQDFDFNQIDSEGNPPLYYILALNPDLDVARKAIEFGSNVNLPAANGIIPLNIATSKANELQLQIMMMKTMGLDINNPEVQEKLKENLFFEMNRVIEMVRMLIDSGADLTIETPLGTPLMNAATNSWNYDIVEMLLQAGANVNQQDKDGKTALFYAASINNDDIIDLLLTAGADGSIKDSNGQTYLDIDRIDVGSVL